MKRFEVGHTYYDQYACDHETLSVIKIVKRTAKMVFFERNGKTRRAMLHEDANGEYIMPDHYSMACVYRAERELVDDEPAEENIITAAVEEAEEPAQAAEVEAEAADNSIRFPAAAVKAARPAAVTGFTVSDSLMAFTAGEMLAAIFGRSSLRAKELDFLAALTEKAIRPDR